MSSRKKAIDNHCRLCIFDRYGGNGTWREQVENCSNSACGLYTHRPCTTKTTQAASKSLKAGKNRDNPSIPDTDEGAV